MNQFAVAPIASNYCVNVLHSKKEVLGITAIDYAALKFIYKLWVSKFVRFSEFPNLLRVLIPTAGGVKYLQMY